MENAVAKKQPASLSAVLQSEEMRKQVAMALPRHMDANRMLRVMLTQIRKVPKLAQCDQGSVLAAFMTCSELGIEPDGRRAHLIPFGKECQLIIDYKGLAELARRSGEVKVIHADVVCENDKFSRGVCNSGPYIDHQPALRNRGEVIGAYSLVVLKDGTCEHEYMNREEIEAIRKLSRAGNAGPWQTHWSEMAKKTVFRRHAKWLPLSAEFRDAVDRDDDRMVDITGQVQTESGAADVAARLSLIPDEIEQPADEQEQQEAREGAKEAVESTNQPNTGEDKGRDTESILVEIREARRLAGMTAIQFSQWCKERDFDPKKLDSYEVSDLERLLKVLQQAGQTP